MYTTAVGGVREVQQTLVAVRHRTSGQEWQLTYVSGIVGPQPDSECMAVLPVHVACPHPPEQLPLAEFGTDERVVLWHRMLTGGKAAIVRRAPSMRRARQSALVLDYYGLRSSPLMVKLSCPQFDAWLAGNQRALFVVMRLAHLTTASAVFGIGWLFPKNPSARFAALNHSPCTMMTSHNNKCLAVHHFIDYLLTRLNICWADTRTHMLCDAFSAQHSQVRIFHHQN
jgi:hypothetical protein